MPKQVKDKTKATRMMLVIEAIKKYGKCAPKDIIQFVANELDADKGNKNFKKNIYNDLKSLHGDNQVGIEYRQKNGEIIPIGEEDHYKNKCNTFYFLIGGEQQVDGAGLFKEVGIEFIKQSSCFPEWSVSNVKHKNQPLKNSLCIFIKHSDKYLCLETSLEDLPANIYFSAKGGFKPTTDHISGVAGNKSSLIMLPSSYLEFATTESLGEFYINFDINKDGVPTAKINYCNPKSENSLDVIRAKKSLTKHKLQIELINNWLPSFLKENPILNRCKETSNYEEFDEYLSTAERVLLDKKQIHYTDKLVILENSFLKGVDYFLDELKETLSNISKIIDKSSNRMSSRQIEICENDYSRVNDYIEDAKSNEPLQKPLPTEKFSRENKGNINSLHAKKPPKGKKSQAKTVSKVVSRMDATSKYQSWGPLVEKEYSLPFSIKIDWITEIVITDIYANSSYNKKAS